MFFPVAFAFGDPHYSTFDGVEYTFRGTGEYIILGLTDDDSADLLLLQGKINDLLIKAVAFGVPGEYGYQVSI